MLKKAENLTDFYNVFQMGALTEDSFDFYQPTALARTGKRYEFHMDLYNRIINASDSVRLLVVGHGGCGKSTEFNKLAEVLHKENYAAIVVNATLDLDRNSFSYVDVIVLIVRNLMQLAEDENVSLSTGLCAAFESALSTEILSKTTEGTAETEVTGKAEAGIGLRGILKLAAALSSSLKMSAGTKTEIRREIAPRVSDIIEATNALLREIHKKLCAKNSSNCQKLIVIIDGLEKCSLELVKNMFLDGSPALTMLELDLIMSCPIGFYRSVDFPRVSSYFPNFLTMPMIKIHQPVERAGENPEEFEAGIETLMQLVLKRADARFFEEGVLKEIILKTGGSLRDLSRALSNIALNAKMEGRETLSLELAREFFQSEGADAFIRIERKDYDCLKKIYTRSYEPRSDEEYANLLYGSAVFEYNGKRWCDLNPVVRDYIDKKGLGILDD